MDTKYSPINQARKAEVAHEKRTKDTDNFLVTVGRMDRLNNSKPDN